jgi:tRNA-specific 2-thiouridylase
LKISKTSKQKKKVLVALSGGIDSAVSAALLLEKGFEVEAAFMKNWSSTTGLLKSECPWLEDRREALKVAAHLGIVLHTFDFEKEYEKRVLKYFFEEYKSGRTPNPDVMCNKEIKFKLLYEKAIAMGFDFLATGHYAQINSDKNGLHLVRSKDEFKDQTYFIYNIRTEQLPHILFPVGGFIKKDIRKLAHKYKLPNADRKESMGLCFVGKIQLDRFLAQKIKPKEGNILDLQGKVLGKHKGAAFYTIGQRQGLGLSGGPYFIVSKDIKKNTLTVTTDANAKEFITKEIQISAVNWIREPKFPAKLKGRFRHQQELQELGIGKPVKGVYKVIFRKNQKAIASGQSLVLYTGKECLGGGVIV